MKRYYLCPLVGAGTQANPRRPRAALYGVNFAALARGDVCLCLVDADDHGPLLADPQMRALPPLGHDQPLSELPAAALDSLKQALAGRGFPADGVNGAMAFRLLLRKLGRHLEPTFDESQLQVG